MKAPATGMAGVRDNSAIRSHAVSIRSASLRGPGSWKKTSARVRRYLTGRLGPFRVLLFENNEHGQEGEPDWILNLGEAQQRQNQETPPQRRHRLAKEIADDKQPARRAQAPHPEPFTTASRISGDERQWQRPQMPQSRARWPQHPLLRRPST